MKKSSLVKLSLATVVAAVALSITPSKSVKASAENQKLRYFNGECCDNMTGNCLPTVYVYCYS